MSTSSLRKTTLINKDLQLKIAGLFALVMILGIILSNCLFYTVLLHRGEVTEGSWQNYVQPIIYTNVLSSIVVTVLAVYMTVFISHRIAGPMFRFSKLMEQVGNGDLNVNTNLRKKDELVAFGAGLAKMAENLKTHINEVKTALADVEKAAGPNPSSELNQAVQRLRGSVQVFRT